MYDSVSNDFMNAVLSLDDFINSASSETEVSEEVSFARTTRNQIAALIGNFAIRAKRYKKE